MKQFINLEKNTSSKCYLLNIINAQYLSKSMILLECKDKNQTYIRLMLPKFVSKLLSLDQCNELKNNYIIYICINKLKLNNVIEIRKNNTINSYNTMYPKNFVKVILNISNEKIEEMFPLPFSRHDFKRKSVITSSLKNAKETNFN